MMRTRPSGLRASTNAGEAPQAIAIAPTNAGEAPQTIAIAPTNAGEAQQAIAPTNAGEARNAIAPTNAGENPKAIAPTGGVVVHWDAATCMPVTRVGLRSPSSPTARGQQQQTYDETQPEYDETQPEYGETQQMEYATLDYDDTQPEYDETQQTQWPGHIGTTTKIWIVYKQQSRNI